MCIDDVKIKLFSTFCSSMYTIQLWWNHIVYNTTYYMYVTIMCLDDFSDHPNTVVRQVGYVCGETDC